MESNEQKFVDNSANVYMNDISKMEVLNSKEQLLLVNKAKEGNLEARNKLIECNMKFIATVAREYLNDRVELFDIIESGVEGLIHAIDKFDPKYNTVFITYAVYWIRQYIQKDINDFNKEVNFNTLLKNGNVDYSDRDDDWNPNDKIEMRDIELNNIDAHKENMLTCKKEFIADMMSFLTNREQKILTMFYGLNNTKEYSMIEIANDLGLSSERTRKIKDGAIHKLRGEIVGKYVRDDIY